MVIKKTKALVLFSGGLDSILVVKLLEEQGIEVTGINFHSVFFPNEEVKKIAKNIGLNLLERDLCKTKGYIEMLKHPKYGYGKGINPCIDCKIFMLKEAKKIMKQKKFDFIATGEVINERPMSQTLPKLNLIEKQSKLQGYLLRPLSAKLLKETIPETKGMVKREFLFDINGRRREKQTELAKKYNLKEYPTPAGGCLLCEKPLKEKLKKLFDEKKVEKISKKDLEFTKIGRHFFFKKTKTEIIIGRNEKENNKLLELKNKNEYAFQIFDFGSPVGILISKSKKPIIKEMKTVGKLVLYYSDCKNKEHSVNYWKNNQKKQNIKQIKIKINDLEIQELLNQKVG